MNTTENLNEDLATATVIESYLPEVDDAGNETGTALVRFDDGQWAVADQTSGETCRCDYDTEPEAREDYDERNVKLDSAIAELAELDGQDRPDQDEDF